MAIRDRIAAYLSKTYALSTSTGVITRNYAKPSEFQPQLQLKGITYKAIDRIGEAVSMYEPQVKKANGDVYANHPLYNLIDKPNNIQGNGSDFLHLWAMLNEVYGETFWYMPKGETTGRPKEVILLNPPQVQLHFDDNAEVDGYILHKNNGHQVPLDVDEVVHDKRANIFNPHRGMSILERASTYVDIEIKSTDFTMNYLANAASPSGVMSLPNMAVETFKQFTQQWRENYEGPQNAGKTAFIRGGEANFTAVGSTLKDIDQKVTREMAKEDVLLMFGVPKGILGGSGEKGLGRNELEPLEYIFAKYTIEPRLRRLDRIFEQVSSNFGREGRVNVTHESTIPDNHEHILARQEKGTNVWMTINEARELDGLEPIPDGDKLMPKVAPVVQQLEPSTKKIVIKKQPSKAEQLAKANAEQEEFRTALVDKNSTYEKKMKRTIAKHSTQQRDKVIDNINATERAYEEWLFSVKEESELLASLLAPIIVELMEAQSEDVANFITGELLTITPEIRRKVEASILEIAGVYTKDTLTAIEQTLTEGTTAGESLSKLKKRVEQVYSDATGYRAERIARTESLRASNNTAELVYKQNGYSRVEWFTNPGACEFCRTFDGTQREIGGKYIAQGDVITGDEGGQLRIDYSDVNVPPLHPNCTCSLIPVGDS